MKPNELKKGIENLRDFLKKVSKKMPDRMVRGFTDHLVYLNQVLDGLVSVLNYTDNPRLEYMLRLERKADKLDADIRKKLAQNPAKRDSTGKLVPTALTDSEKEHMIFSMLAGMRAENREKFGGAFTQKHWTKMSKKERNKGA